MPEFKFTEWFALILATVLIVLLVVTSKLVVNMRITYQIFGNHLSIKFKRSSV